MEENNMKIHDISGIIREGIWKYGPAYPDYRPVSTSAEPGKCFFEIFEGFNSQTGTYLETAAHVNGYEGNRLIADVDVSRLYNIPCRVLHVKPDGKKITAAHFEKAALGMTLPEGCALLIDSGHDDWYEEDFLTSAPWMTLDAMEWLLDKKPSLIGSDTPAWQKEEPVFDLFAPKDILLLAPLTGLSKTDGRNALLTVLPLNIEKTCCAPARAVLVEE